MLRLPSRGSFVVRAFTLAPRFTSCRDQFEAVEISCLHRPRQIETGVVTSRPGDLMEGGPALRVSVRVCSTFEEQTGELVVRVHHREDAARWFRPTAAD